MKFRNAWESDLPPEQQAVRCVDITACCDAANEALNNRAIWFKDNRAALLCNAFDGWQFMPISFCPFCSTPIEVEGF